MSEDDAAQETRMGQIRHRTRAVRKGIQMLRLERQLEPILEKWREAMRKNPEEWK